ncbi:MAG TPA: ferredoxin reductase [Solirubrobacteraceae bacterium]|nr:ferredoxin reductase [Solirubrobacteraceae bacterium]
MERLTAVAQRAPGAWQIARVAEIRRETPTVKTFRIAPPMWVAHLPGQHYEVRLTAPDGYRAQRSYSIASSPVLEGLVELTVERLDDGEVSAYMHDVLQEGDEIEVRGPFATYFVWRGEEPALLVGGGSGVVPLMAMLRHRRLVAPEVPMRMVYSVRTPEQTIFASELGAETHLAYTRSAPEGWTGHRGRIDRPLLAAAADGFLGGPAFVCGSNGFVEAASELLLGCGFAPGTIRTERFGPTG